MDPNFIPARSLMGHIYEQKGLYEEAVAEYMKVIDGVGRDAISVMRPTQFGTHTAFRIGKVR